MIAETLRDVFTRNLIATYFELGLATSSGETWIDSGFRACLGDLDHPICNFAAELRLDPWSVRRLRDLAASRGAFNVYVLPGDQPDHLTELLVRAGFKQQYELAQMIAKPSALVLTDCSPALVPHEVIDLRARFKVARFMADQFFPRQAELFKKRVATVTAQASRLRLYEMQSSGTMVGGVMLSAADGVLGIYNLCVAAAHRGNGFGADLVRWAQAQASQLEGVATLQCDERMVAWYEHLGFQSVGKIRVYTLCHDDMDVILEPI